ncbi:MAG: hypothetical protein HQM02_08785 [Magnetococcales bacterium]|nr:hypothetical protein [Magnetococcales bacterium]
MGTASIALALFVVCFLLVQLDKVDRGAAMLSGAVLFLLLGDALRFYSLDQAFAAIYFDSLALLFGISLISNCLYRSGVFHHLAFHVARYSLGNPLLIMVLLTLTTYSLSLAFNNLSVMIIMLPPTLVLCRALAMDPAPIMAAELIASNLGGASTLVGDFPNMIIGAVARLHFDDFIGGMMVPCLVLLAALLLFFHRHLERSPAAGRTDLAALKTELFAQSPAGSLPDRLDPYLLRLGLAVFMVTLFSFFVAQPLGIRPAAISFAAGLVILALGRLPQSELFTAISGGDLLFFSDCSSWWVGCMRRECWTGCTA